jgi:hypothetical protein
MDAFDYILSHEGGEIGPIAVHEFPLTGRGVCATQALSPRLPLATVPHSLVITSTLAAAGYLPLLRCLGEAGGSLSSLLDDDALLSLAAHLLRHAGAVLEGLPTPLQPYLASLPPPSDVCCVVGAGCWHVSELQALRDASLVQQGLQRAGQVEAAYQLLLAAAQAQCSAGAPEEALALQRCLRSALLPSPALWRWCVACATSRAFVYGQGLELSLGRLPLALVPGVDLLNHRDAGRGAGAVEMHWLQGAGGQPAGVQLRCLTSAQPGQELFLSYGDRTARDLVENYGFCLPPLAAPTAAAAAAATATASEGLDLALAPALQHWLPSQLLRASPGGEAQLQQRLALLAALAGLPLQELELELPLAAAAQASRALPTDTARALRALCLCPAELLAVQEGREAGEEGQEEALARPLSRGNEVLANALLAALLASQLLPQQQLLQGCTGSAGAQEGSSSQEALLLPHCPCTAAGLPGLPPSALHSLSTAAGAAVQGLAAYSTGAEVTAFALRVHALCVLLAQSLQSLLVEEEAALALCQQQQQKQQQQAAAVGAGQPPWQDPAQLELMMQPCATGRRAHVAAGFRVVRATVLLAHASRLVQLLGVASGLGAGTPVAPPATSAAAVGEAH